jgi:hypothetical protein
MNTNNKLILETSISCNLGVESYNIFNHHNNTLQSYLPGSLEQQISEKIFVGS